MERENVRTVVRVMKSFMVTLCLIGVLLLMPMVVQAGNSITSMSYFSTNDGPIITKTGSNQESFGFVMPIFNGGAATFAEVASDLAIKVLVNGSWIDIDSSSFVYNVNWGHWNDGGFTGYWFMISETTQIRLESKANGVTLDYTLQFNNVPKTTITSLAYTQGPNITAGITGGSGFTYPIFNGNIAIPYAAVADDLKVYVKPLSSSTWIDIDNNAASGWIYDQNFGQFTDGGGGYWFTVTESINVKLESKTSGANLIYTIAYSEAIRNTYIITPFDQTTFTADPMGAIGFPLPRIDGGAPYNKELENFVYEIKVDGTWYSLWDSSYSKFSYSPTGYNRMSDANQWGYWVDGVYGLWFQPIQVNMELRIGYPLNGQKGGAIGSNYVNYNFIGNPNAPRPDVTDMADIVLSTPQNPAIQGMNLVWQDEFTGNSLDTGKWNYDTGYYLNADPNTWGWGNNELQHYTSNARNVSVQNGNLTITAHHEPKSFPEDPNRYAQYSSGKITTKGKFNLQYGRVDIRAKLPTGNGIWPALWMLPESNVYGTWALSGEIDIMEARGRLPGVTTGAIHFGGQWPANTHLGGEYYFPSGQTFASDYHVYSVIWEDDNIKWYVNGKCFFKATNEQWYSLAAQENNNAPFDQPFYLIMNLAIGGNFDGGLIPDSSDIPATMEVDYIRVYKEGAGTTPIDPETPEPTHVPVTGLSLSQTTLNLATIGEMKSLSCTILPTNASNQNLVWSSSSAQVATVANGVITAVGNGTATITVRSVDGNFTAACNVTVNVATQIEFTVGDSVKGLRRINDQIIFYVNGATFADIHYRLNNGPQLNIAMTSSGGSNFIHSITGLKAGDILDYSFTYNPGNGALDTSYYQYIHGITTGSGNNDGGSTVSNLALNKSVTTSGNESPELSGNYMVDNNLVTRWSSNFADDAWFIIDLGNAYQVSEIILHWEAAYGKKYQVQLSTNGVSYTNIANITAGTGGIESITLNNQSVRYIKFQGVERALPYGYSLWEVKVMGK